MGIHPMDIPLSEYASEAFQSELLTQKAFTRSQLRKTLKVGTEKGLTTDEFLARVKYVSDRALAGTEQTWGFIGAWLRSRNTAFGEGLFDMDAASPIEMMAEPRLNPEAMERAIASLRAGVPAHGSKMTSLYTELDITDFTERG